MGLQRCDVRGTDVAVGYAQSAFTTARTSQRSQPASAPGRGESRVLRPTEADTVTNIRPHVAAGYAQSAALHSPDELFDSIDDAWLVTARACECSAKRGMASIGSAADVIDSSRLPYIHDCRSRQSC